MANRRSTMPPMTNHPPETTWTRIKNSLEFKSAFQIFLNSLQLSPEELSTYTTTLEILFYNALIYEDQIQSLNFLEVLSTSVTSIGNFAILTWIFPNIDHFLLIILSSAFYLFHLFSYRETVLNSILNKGTMSYSPEGVFKPEALTELLRNKPIFYGKISTEELTKIQGIPANYLLVSYRVQSLAATADYKHNLSLWIKIAIKFFKSAFWYGCAFACFQAIGGLTINSQDLAFRILTSFIPFTWNRIVEVHYFYRSQLLEIISQPIHSSILNQKQIWLEKIEAAYKSLATTPEQTQKIKQLKDSLGTLFILNYEINTRRKIQKLNLLISSALAFLVATLLPASSLLRLLFSVLLMPAFYSLTHGATESGLLIFFRKHISGTFKIPSTLPPQAWSDYLLTSPNLDKIEIVEEACDQAKLLISDNPYAFSFFSDLRSKLVIPDCEILFCTQQKVLYLSYLLTLPWCAPYEPIPLLSAAVSCLASFVYETFLQGQKSKTLHNIFDLTTRKTGLTTTVVKNLSTDHSTSTPSVPAIP